MIKVIKIAIVLSVLVNSLAFADSSSLVSGEWNCQIVYDYGVVTTNAKSVETFSGATLKYKKIIDTKMYSTLVEGIGFEGTVIESGKYLVESDRLHLTPVSTEIKIKTSKGLSNKDIDQMARNVDPYVLSIQRENKNIQLFFGGKPYQKCVMASHKGKE